MIRLNVLHLCHKRLCLFASPKHAPLVQPTSTQRIALLQRLLRMHARVAKLPAHRSRPRLIVLRSISIVCHRATSWSCFTLHSIDWMFQPIQPTYLFKPDFHPIHSAGTTLPLHHVVDE